MKEQKEIKFCFLLLHEYPKLAIKRNGIYLTETGWMKATCAIYSATSESNLVTDSSLALPTYCA